MPTDEEVRYHRSFVSLARVPYVDFEVRTDVFVRAGARTAFQWDKQALYPIMIREKKDQDFRSYATPWELARSRLLASDYADVVSSRGWADPIVDIGHTLIVGHVGLFSGGSVLENEDGSQAVVAGTPASNARTMFTEVTYRVVTDVNGRALWVSPFDSNSIQASWSPFDFISLRGVIAGIGKAGARAVMSLFAKETEKVALAEGAILVNRLRAAGQRIVINIGGTGEEVGAINLNPNIVAPRVGIPNHIARPAEEIGALFERNSIEEIVSNRLPPNTLDWPKILPGAREVMQDGAKLSIRFQGVGKDASIIMPLLKSLGFKDIKNFMGAAIEAVK